jgi:hypothetical protein
MPTTIFQVFDACVSAVRSGQLIRRESRQDKEFHFQNWFRDRLAATGLNSEPGGRNSYPDFRMVAFTEGYEVKGLAYPGREANYDSNSQVPSGWHNGRSIYYVFGRYPAAPDGDTYPVLDLVLCHGDFLNANHDYVHKNRSVKGFGTYGDIMIRDRKMYVAPTPFGLLNGVAHNVTLILPRDTPEIPAGFVQVGELVRREADLLIVGYAFDLLTNELIPHTVPNPNAGHEHLFRAWRLSSQPPETVEMRAHVVLETPDEEAE